MGEQQRVPQRHLSTAFALALLTFTYAINSQLGFTIDY